MRRTLAVLLLAGCAAVLPGNPVSALVCFWIYARPALRRLAGHRALHLPVVHAVLGARLGKTKELTEFVRVRLERTADGVRALPAPSQSSGVLTSLAGDAGLLVAPAGTSELAAGAMYPVILPGAHALDRETAPELFP